MGNYMRISTGNMRSDAEQIREDAGHIPEAVDQLAEALNGLSSCWDGPAKGTFLAQVSTDIECMKEVYGILQKFLEDLGYSGEQYDTCENKVYDTFGKMFIW
ncbi:MAG: hypothetical protein Q4C02_01665 [Eubacteriales bacterium]|nr:hypothetical protein [Eubacteriales bacterium]